MADINTNARAFSTSRNFEPRERLPVSGQPQAEFQRPANSPGIIPVADINEASETVAENINDIERNKLESVDYQIILHMLNPENSDEQTKPTYDLTVKKEAPSDVKPVPDNFISSHAESDTSIQVTTNVTETTEPVQTETKSDPLVLDLDGNGLQTGEELVQFDIDADGQLDRISTLAGADAFLALDRDNSGYIEDGSELFGDQHNAVNGFSELARFDINKDNRIDAQDSVFSSLRLFRPEIGDLGSLTDVGIRSIELTYQNTRLALNAYDEVAQLGQFEYDDGSQGLAADLLFSKQ